MILRSTVPCTFLLQLVALRLRAGVITHLSNCSVWLSSNEENFSVQDMYSRLSSCRVQTKNQQRRELIASDNRPSTAEFKRRTGTKRTFCSGGGTSGGRLGEWHAASNLRSLNCSPPITPHTNTHHLHHAHASTRLVDTRTKHAARMGVRRPRESRDMEEGD